MRLLTLPFVSLILVCYSYQATGQNNIANHFQENSYPGPVPKTLFVDTTLSFSDLNQLISYRDKKMTELNSFINDSLKLRNASFTSYIRDSLLYRNRDLFYWLHYKYLLQSEKNLVNFRTLYPLFNNNFTIEDPLKLKLFESYPIKFRTSPAGIKIRKLLDQFNINLGFNIRKYSYFTVKDINGNPIKFPALFSERYSYFLLVFGASWCRPCNYEDVLLKSKFHLIDTSKVMIISLSLDNDWQKWLRSVKDGSYPWNSYNLQGGFKNELVQRLGISSIPRNILLNRDMTILFEHTDISIVLKNLKSRMF